MPNAAGGVTGVRIDAGIFTKLAGSTNDVTGSLTVSRSGNPRINAAPSAIENFRSASTQDRLLALSIGQSKFGNEEQNRRLAQHLLHTIGFDVGGATPTGELCVRSTSAIIMVQWAAGISVTGEADARTLEVLMVYTLLNVNRGHIMEAATPWENQQPERVGNSGFYTGSLTRLPNTRNDRGDGTIQPVVAVAWARMVQSALDDGRASTIDEFGLAGSAAGYRDFHMQVEAWAAQQTGFVTLAAAPVFSNQATADNWINVRENRRTIDGSWRSIPRELTQPGGPLHGTRGTSDHGYATAIDFNFAANPGGGTYTWLRNNAYRYGFRRTGGSENFHWEYMRR